MNDIVQPSVPLILAPAGNKASFLAALAAGADAVYCGLKSFSARMEAKNFSLEELSALTQLAHDKGVKVYVALNSLVKHDELIFVGKLIDQLNKYVNPDALIIQDLSIIKLAHQAQFAGELHLSTLTNVSFACALDFIKKNFKGVTRVVLPRELNIDEIKAVAKACPKELELEVFIHGALCYGVSGRCYWSSYFGGKSSLRGRCVQPCRRLYSQNNMPKRFFSCQDLSLDVLVKVLKTIPKISAWKIEGRKKGPHYVFYTVKAYKMLRDHGNDPKMKKAALSLLEQALGRTGTHYNFLPQRPQLPVNTGTQTGSGLLMGIVKGGRQKPYLIPRQELFSGDILRIGYEDESWHRIHKVSKYVPKKGKLFLKVSSKRPLSQGAPVFLTDRREQALQDMLSEQEKAIEKIKTPKNFSSNFIVKLPEKNKKQFKIIDLELSRYFIQPKRKNNFQGLWLSYNSFKKVPKSWIAKIWWFLPPVIWPDDEEKWQKLIMLVLNKGGKNFMLNSPWQMKFFSEKQSLNLWAGPFCNIANPMALNVLSSLGFKGSIVSPELGNNDYINLPLKSPFALGIVISGNWPLCISRTFAENLKTDILFTSPKGEGSWAVKYQSDFWVYPNWKIDISKYKNELQKAGYSMFINISEPVVKGIKLKNRPGLWNWNLNLR